MNEFKSIRKVDPFRSETSYQRDQERWHTAKEIIISVIFFSLLFGILLFGWRDTRHIDQVATQYCHNVTGVITCR